MCNENLRVEFSLQTAQYAPVLIVDQKLTSINILWHLDFDNKMLLYRWRTAAVFCDHWCALPCSPLHVSQHEIVGARL